MIKMYLMSKHWREQMHPMTVLSMILLHYYYWCVCVSSILLFFLVEVEQILLGTLIYKNIV